MRETQLTPQLTPASQPLWFGGNDESNNDKHYVLCASVLGEGLIRALVTKEVAKTKTRTSVCESAAVMFLIIAPRRLTAPPANEAKRSTIMARAHSIPKTLRSATGDYCRHVRLDIFPTVRIRSLPNGTRILACNLDAIS